MNLYAQYIAALQVFFHRTRHSAAQEPAALASQPADDEFQAAA